MSRKIPEDLRAAWQWTSDAAELDELCGMSERDADVYASESEANAIEHEVYDVTAGDVLALRAWLRSLGPTDTTRS